MHLCTIGEKGDTIVKLYHRLTDIQKGGGEEEMDCKVVPFYKTTISLQKGGPYKRETSVLRKNWYNC